MATGGKRQGSQVPKPAPKRSKMVAIKTAEADSNNSDTSLSQANAIAEQSTSPGITGDDLHKAFCAEVKENERDALARLEALRKKRKDDRAKFESGMVQLFLQAMLPLDAAEADEDITEDDGKLKVQFTAMGQQAYGDRIADLVDASHSLIEQYGKLTVQQPAKSRLDEVKTTFEKDKQGALAMLAAGRRVAATDIQNMLADRYHEVRGRGTTTREEDLKGRHLLSQGQREDVAVQRGELGWGNVAAEAKKAVAKLEQVAKKR